MYFTGFKLQSNKPALLIKLGQDTSSLRDNPWLTGFIEADGTNQLILQKNSMNTLRTQYNWDSLNRFYTI